LPHQYWKLFLKFGVPDFPGGGKAASGLNFRTPFSRIGGSETAGIIGTAS